MASLTFAKLDVTLAWTQEHAITGFDSSEQASGIRTSILPTISSSAASEVYQVQVSLAAGASQTIDLSSLTEPAFGQALTPTGAYMIVVYGTGTTWKYDGGTSNQFYWFLGGATQSINSNAGDVFAYGSTTAGAISGAAKNIRVTNTAGSGTLTATVAVILKTA